MGGVYVCEDLVGTSNRQALAFAELANELHGGQWQTEQKINANRLQRWVASVTIYPFLIVVEKLDTPVNAFESPKHGTMWQPSAFWRAQTKAAELSK